MGLHIMASKRIPRKVKKALKYVYLLPRRNGNMIQYGGVGIIGNRSKWKRKAAKVLRARDYRKMLDMMTSRLKDLYSSTSYPKLDIIESDFFEWEVQSQAELMLKKTFDDFDMDTFVRRHIETQMRYWTTDSVRHQVANLLADRLVILSEDNEKINDSKHQLKN